MSKVRTDNSHLQEKIKLRIQSINDLNKKEINILECFAGDGIIWNEVKKCTNKKINILKIEKKYKRSIIYLKGENLKFLEKIDLQNFDIIDLDTYGSPFKQLEIIFKKNYKGIVCVTFINTEYGRMEYNLLKKAGYSISIIKKCPTIFSKNALNIISCYLYKNGIDEIIGYFMKRKNYFYFKIK